MTKREMGLLLCAWWLTLNPIEGAAYELRTHERVTASAFEASEAVRTYLDDIGIGPGDVFDLGSRTLEDQLARFTNTGTPRDWMIEGAIREDDHQDHLGLALLGCDRPRNPPSQIDRPLRHFLDVQRDGRGLTVGPFGATSATEWALGHSERGADPTKNQFSLLDARVYQLRSLTASAREERDRNTALLFRTLGQVIHILQDMAQPQHTRNDLHTGCVEVIAGERSWYEDYLERRALGQRFRQRADQPFPLPSAAYPPPRFAAYPEFFTEPDGKGLADFSSRNFFSAGTNLSVFETCGGLPEPPCRRDAYVQRQAPFAFTAVDGTTVAGTVALFLRSVQDPVTGEVIQDVAVSSRSLWDQHLEQRGFFPRFTLNTLNYDAISEVLLPRAVGYSAGFLDSFFRGRLDVDLVQVGPDDPALVKLRGVNASNAHLGSKMEGGTLKLYVEDVDSKERREVATLDADTKVTAEVGAQIESGRFVVPADAEKFVAVYTGQLGSEVPADTNGQGLGPPAGVIGKVLGGVRVEEVFFDGSAWNLRTPDGIFPLPISGDDVKGLVWGDADNTLVGRSALGPGSPNQFFAYRIDRPVGSRATPLGPDGKVRLVRFGQAVLIDGLDIGTTIEYTGTTRYRQHAISYLNDRRVLHDRGTILSETFTPEFLVTSGTAQLNKTIRLTLDFDKLDAFSGIPYVWSVNQFGLTADGRIVAVVAITLTSLDDTVTIMVPKFETPCRSFPCPRVDVEAALRFAFPRQFSRTGSLAAVTALIDVTTGAVMGSTAPPVVPIEVVTELDAYPANCGQPCAIEARRLTFADRPDLSPVFVQFGPVQAFGAWNIIPCSPPAAGVVSFGSIQRGPGQISVSMPLYRDELQSLRSFTPVVERSETVGLGCISDGELRSELPQPAVDLTEVRQFLNADGVAAVQRARSAPERLIVVLKQAQGPPSRADEVRVIAWDPSVAQAMLRYTTVDLDSIRLASTNRQAAILIASQAMTLVPLEDAGGAKVFPIPFQTAQSFRALEPSMIYNVADQRFYRTSSGLERTALPRLLAPGGSSAGDYHAVGLK